MRYGTKIETGMEYLHSAYVFEEFPEFLVIGSGQN
jgi:hypothetical protein